MTKKDYIKLARLIKGSRAASDMGDIKWNEIIISAPFIDGLCDILKDDNPRFDRERFITACK